MSLSVLEVAVTLIGDEMSKDDNFQASEAMIYLARIGQY